MSEDKGEMGPLLAALHQAEQENEALFEQAAFREVVASLIDVAHRAAVHGVAAASPAGERLVGAMLLEASDLHPWRPGESDVLVVDAVVVTGLGVRTRAAQARSLGAQVVHGVVVKQLGDKEDERKFSPLASLTTVQS
jgi:hypothetical protein